MKKLLPIILLLLSGCTVPVPITFTWPDVPSELTSPAPDLTPLSDKDLSFTSMLLNVNSNFSQYYQLKKKYEAWQEWYITQQKIYKEVK